jgi:hypothetical protein
MEQKKDAIISLMDSRYEFMKKPAGLNVRRVIQAVFSSPSKGKVRRLN